MRVAPVLHVVLLSAAVISISGCRKPAEKTEAAAPAAPAAATTPAPEQKGPGLTAEQQQKIAAGQTLGNCFDNTTCTPAGNPPPGWGAMTQDECKTKGSPASWKQINQSAQETGPCVTPP